MLRHGTNLQISPSLLTVFALCLGVFLFFFSPTGVEAEGNEPTNTPLPTWTPIPEVNIIPTETQVLDDSALLEKSISQPDISFDDNASPLSPSDEGTQPKSLTASLGSTNLCLIGGIVLGTIVVMIMVVFGVIQRIRPES